jgi:hypothetical protein
MVWERCTTIFDCNCHGRRIGEMLQTFPLSAILQVCIPNGPYTNLRTRAEKKVFFLTSKNKLPQKSVDGFC